LFIITASSWILAGSATSGFHLPATAIAFRFFDPITAPAPPRPWASFASFITAAYRTRCSPAGPIPAVRSCFSPVSAAIASRASSTVFPHKCAASRSSTRWSVTNRYTGASARPSTITASYPAFFSAIGKKPPASLFEYPSVSGDFVPIQLRDAPGSGSPVSGPIAMISLFRGSNASIPRGTSFSR
jgi:hypothetical protein